MGLFNRIIPYDAMLFDVQVSYNQRLPFSHKEETMPDSSTGTRLALLWPDANSSTKASPNSSLSGFCISRGRLDGAVHGIGDDALSSGDHQKNCGWDPGQGEAWMFHT